MKRLQRFFEQMCRATLLVMAAVGLGGLAFMAFVEASPSLKEGCELKVGQRVVLTADTVDPDVFVWDSRPRLVAYVSGAWPSTKEILAHTILVGPGTLALVVACHPKAAHPKYETSGEDVLGVQILTGSSRAHWGWVVSGDAHAMRSTKKR